MAVSKEGFKCSYSSNPMNCSICKLILREPHTVNCCKKNFCKGCISEVKKRCPSCQKSDFIHYPNKDLHDVLLQFQVYCTNECGWWGALKAHDDHLNTPPSDERWLEGCCKVEVQCIHCRNEVKSRQHFLKYLEKAFNQSKVENICTITGDLVHTKWFQIGHELKLDSGTLDKIQQNNKKTKECYVELVKEWIKRAETANWIMLLEALRNVAVEVKSDVERSKDKNNIILLLIQYHYTGIVCDKASEQDVKQLTEESKEAKQEYQRTRYQLELWAAELESKGLYLEDKKRELEKLKFSYTRAKQLQKIGEELLHLKEELKSTEKKISSIENELQEGIEEKKVLIKQIAEGERQLKNTKDRINSCLRRLNDQIKHLEWEENAKLLSRDLGKTNRIPFQVVVGEATSQAIIGAGVGGIAAAVVGVVAAGATGGSVLGMYVCKGLLQDFT